MQSNDFESARRGPNLRLFGRSYALPRSRGARTVVGGGLIVFGLLGFLPVVGFWMLPLGLLVLATDSPTIRRFNRRAGVWMKRRFRSNSKPASDGEQ